jgi:hypothetical protein
MMIQNKYPIKMIQIPGSSEPTWVVHGSRVIYRFDRSETLRRRTAPSKGAMTVQVLDVLVCEGLEPTVVGQLFGDKGKKMAITRMSLATLLRGYSVRSDPREDFKPRLKRKARPTLARLSARVDRLQDELVRVVERLAALEAAAQGAPST